MALKDIFTMVKADRYTADGCEVLNKAREADVEDRTYQIGEISQKTGLQKTANGWVKPKKGNGGSAKKDASGTTKMTPEQKSKWEAKAANSSETTASLRNFISSMSKPEAKANPHADEIVEIYKKELAKRENNPRYRPEKVYPNTPSASEPTDETDSAGNKRPSTDVAYLKGSKDPQLKADVKKAIATHHATGNNLLNVLYNKDKELYKKLDAMGTTNAEQFINQLAHDSAPRVLTGDCRIRVRKA